MDPGAARNREEPKGIPLMQLYVSYVFTTGIMCDWTMTMIEDNLVTLNDPSSVQSWIESSKHGQDEKFEI